MRKYANLVTRALAALVIDPLLVFIVIFSIAFTIKQTLLDTLLLINSLSPVITILDFLYPVVFWVNWNGQTIGKKLFGIKVVRLDSKPIDYRTAVIRAFGYYLSLLPLMLGFFWAIWDEKKQGWHDKLAGTIVVKVR